MNPIYRQFLRLGSSGTQQAVHPVWKDDTAIEWKQESGEMFYRAELSSAFTFIREDFDLINGADFDTEFFFDFEKSADNGLTWSAYFTGSFYKTDCTFTPSDRKVTVKPTVRDRYTDILAGMEKEYDIIPLAPVVTPITVTRRPALQIYTLGESVVTFLMGGQSWEQDVVDESIGGNRLMDYYHFGLISDSVEMTFDGWIIQGLQQPFQGSWAVGHQTGEWTALTNSENIYYITYFQDSYVANDQLWYKNGLRIKRVSDNAVVWVWEQAFLQDWHDVPDMITFEPTDIGTHHPIARHTEVGVFGRWVLGGDTWGQAEAEQIPSDDIVANNRNYQWCFPLENGSTYFLQTPDYSAAPTQWGIRPDGKYYVKPSSLQFNDFIPVGMSYWRMTSYWFGITATFLQTEQSGWKQTPIRDAFAVDSVISTLLAQFAPNVTFQDSPDWSVFLYGVNPIVNRQIGRLIMSPKSNIKVSEYTQPARKAMVTLKDILDMLRKTHGLYWFIDDSGRLRIEHISWFRNGGSYSADQRQVGVDLTTMINIRSGKAYGEGQTEYSYDKPDMPERYQYGWMDDATLTFNGSAIEVLSPYVQEGRIEEVGVSMFNADIDYILLNPSDVSDDGFALMSGRLTSDGYQTDIITIIIGTKAVQNYDLAFSFLQEAYLTYDMPAWDLKVNGLATTAKGIQLKKKQQVVFPAEDADPDLAELVRTAVGDGVIEKVSIVLTSRQAKASLVFPTCENPNNS